MISDYQCPDCFKYENQMMEILESRNDVSLSVKHYPFNSDCNPSVNSQKHANACWAARAAETAGILGGNDAFWKMHTWLFKQKGNFTNKEILGYVRTIGIDPIEFQRLINSEEVNDLIDLDVVEGEKLGVLFTPMIFINGVEMKWYHIPQRFSTTIDKVAAAINAGDPSAAPRTPPSGREKLLLDWKEGRHRSVPETTHDLKRGNPDATLQVVVWGEYTSRDYLQKLRDHLMPILEKYPDHSFSYRVFPMSNDCNRKVNIKITDYPYACLTARAIKAAIVTGTPEQAWQFHNWLIDYGIQIDDSLLIAGAAQVGLDPIQFQQALESAEVEAMVAEDVSHGIRMSFRGPPAIFVNGRYVPRWSPESTDSVLDRIMVEAIAEKQGK
jgi:protein-disulfide isomerase